MKTKKHIQDFIVKLKEINLDIDFEILYLDTNSIFKYWRSFEDNSSMFWIWYELYEWHWANQKDVETIQRIKQHL